MRHVFILNPVAGKNQSALALKEKIAAYFTNHPDKEYSIRLTDGINDTLLRKWKGEGADAYKKETDHILENIGGIKDVLDGINNSAIKSIRDEYSKLDEELGEFNRNPKTE